jgi:hypothetical protein
MSNQIQEWEVEPETGNPYDYRTEGEREAPMMMQTEPVDQVFDSIMQPSQANQTASVLSEAIKRIEQAKLYETLLKHSLFGEGSARPEIIEAVQSEIRIFALNRLELLLGMKAPQEQRQVQVKSPFSEEEVTALRALASRVISRDAPMREANPQIVQVQSNSSAVGINEIRPLAQRMVAVQQRTENTQQNQAPVQPTHRGPGRPRKSQAVNPHNKPIPMPSNDAMNQINANLAAKMERAMGGSTLGSAVSISTALAKNSNEGE